jgi:hypothetical protein
LNEKATAIKSACEYAIKRWLPQDGVTFCNCAVNYISGVAGFHGFKGLVANEIINFIKKSPDFAKVDVPTAQKLANDGRLVIAGRMDEPHGHVACVYPGGEVVNSRKWHEEACTIANIGSTNGVMGANWSFGLPPAYWTWIESV